MGKRWIGVEPRAELVYRTLLRLPRCRAGDLAGILGWSARDVEQAVERLRAEQLVVSSGDDPLGYRAVQPTVALPSLAARRLKDRRRGDLPSASAVEKLIAEHEPAADQRTKLLCSVDETAATAEQLVGSARHEALFVVRRFRPGSFEFSRHLVESVLRRRATVRMVWAKDLLRLPVLAEFAAWLAERDIRPRIADVRRDRMVIVDGVTALMSNARDESWVERRAAVVDSLHESADELWTAGTAMRDVMPVVVPGGPAWERHELVLRLLADGLTDEMVARRLGVSVRTVRNDVACTMSALDANSRFQAGARAAQLGLV